jgi:hypothetical protein
MNEPATASPDVDLEGDLALRTRGDRSCFRRHRHILRRCPATFGRYHGQQGFKDILAGRPELLSRPWLISVARPAR